MSLRSFTTARLMETWAHGQDVVDGLGLDMSVARPATDRLRHIAYLGCATRGWSYTVRGRTPPDSPMRVELTLPSGDRFVHGPEIGVGGGAGAPATAVASVEGTALDFCLVVTQRRNVVDTDLALTGAPAHDWMAIAQCFAGGPTLAPRPRR